MSNKKVNRNEHNVLSFHNKFRYNFKYIIRVFS